MIYSIDPGETTGVAIGDDQGKLVSMSQHSWEHLPAYINSILDADLFIVEEFRIRPDKAMSFSFSDMKTIQAVGMFKLRAHQLGASSRYQRPLDKTVGYKWAGTPPPKAHSLSHQVDAYAHLVFYWVKVLGLPPPAAARLTPIDNVSKTL